jgi:hypothetical protein
MGGSGCGLSYLISRTYLEKSRQQRESQSVLVVSGQRFELEFFHVRSFKANITTILLR